MLIGDALLGRPALSSRNCLLYTRLGVRVISLNTADPTPQVARKATRHSDSSGGSGGGGGDGGAVAAAVVLNGYERSRAKEQVNGILSYT